ncbi:hypothetical protein CYANOKiyG1_23900 [Okeania sp. KiyG1]|nr:hypothetical protein CYANOKiyG1_23900 [Okeania sp. KiyG1]
MTIPISAPTQLIRENQTIIVVEDLAVRTYGQESQPTPSSRRGARGVGSDANWGELVRQLAVQS